jgi:hypothetical protein
MHGHRRQIILARQHKGQLAVLDQLQPVALAALHRLESLNPFELFAQAFGFGRADIF